ncbi:MerR family transcriptional regulator [Actinoallomurus bryophytorum]|uniref:DNA-binding transcriptional MerR regulator n=1 Tax=Actinoallomurus bryophytorum TaxID=1490222 RepID=A0A543CD15_9ACTN|nr:MerR family transcriptional regulator [Actinoallomurus bryophytorum]TQL94995.1 DNA-binding transcriptional MerR regulator [Actinoallomurus bryophytorum]
MFTIGDFARYGRVSVRMLRHYDAIGLLRPDRVDPASGYRFYDAAQLTRLNRVIALKDLGFTLQQVRTILDERVRTDELYGMLRLRRAELEARMNADAARLTRVEARLRMIESEGHMPTADVVLKRLPAVRVAELTGIAASFAPEDIGPVIQPLYPELDRRLAQAGVTVTGPGIAYYEDSPEGTITVHASLPVAVAPKEEYEFAVVDLPAVASAATIVHHGSMDEVVATEQILARWLDTHGHRATGHARELYLDCPQDAPGKWVTELQAPVEAD